VSKNFNRPWHRFYSEGVSPSLDYPKKALPGMLEEISAQYGDVDAYIFYGKKTTYKEYNEQVGRFATALSRLGVNKGDRVAIMAPNSPYYMISYYAVLKLGAIVVQTNPMYTEREVSHQLKDSGAETMIVYDALFPTVAAAKPQSSLNNIIVFSLGEEKTIEGEDVHRFDTLIVASPNDPPQVDINLAEDVAVLQYTGGTTGTAKGAMLTHQNILYNAHMIKCWDPDMQMATDRGLAVLPLFHSYGMTCVMNAGVLLAATGILVPRFEPQEILKLIQGYKPTMFHGVPTMYAALLQQPNFKDFDTSSIRLCNSGGAALPIEVHKNFVNATGASLFEGYGLSEASPVTHANPLDNNRVGTIGIPFPDTDCKVVDLATGEEVPVGERGELIIKGPQVMKGYWNMPEENAASLKDGWLYTGDIAIVDEDGYFSIVDRKKEMIIAGGYNIYPREVEEVLYECPGVVEAAVAGVPDQYRGETVWAFVVTKEGSNLTEQEIIKFCRDKMASYKAPRKVQFMGELPKTAVGKILRRKLSEQAKAVVEG